MSLKISAIILTMIFCSTFLFAQDGAAEPELMSYKEYGTIRHERPYILRFNADKGALLYFGIGHVYRKDDPQIARLESEFLAFKPTLLLHESGTPSVAATAEETIEKYGEPGLLMFFAKKHNLPIKSLDPARMDEIKHLMNLKRWSMEQIFLFYVLRRIPQNNQKVAPQSPDAIVQSALDQTAKAPGFESLPKTLSEFDALAKKHFPQVKDWRAIEQRYFDPNPDLGHFTNDIADASVQYRGRFMIRLLEAEVAKGERVFAVVGASHVVKQERALKKHFSSAK